VTFVLELEVNIWFFLILLIFVFRYLAVVIELGTFVLKFKVLVNKSSNLSKLDEFIFF